MRLRDLLFLILTLVSLQTGATPVTSASEVKVNIDAREPGSGEITVHMQIRGIKGKAVFRGQGVEPEYTYRDVRILDGAGRPVDHRQRGDLWLLNQAAPPLLQLEYKVRPGGHGRHGQQGWIDEHFASFDGRVFILPTDTAITKAQIHFQVPDGWSIAAPFDPVSEGFAVPDRGSMTQDLQKTCVALGPFEKHSKAFGTTSVDVFSYRSWPPAHKAALADKTWRLYEYFYQRFGFAPGRHYTVVWLPKAEGRKVFGGAWSNGMCFDAPRNTPRTWQVFTHRLAHALNRDVPHGLLILGPDDHWLDEAWATYLEMEATAATGVISGTSGWSNLYRRYLDYRFNYPSKDLPLAQESVAASGIVEYLHYVKAPLVLRMLAWQLHQQGRSFDSFMQNMWPRYRGRAVPFPFRVELERYTGRSWAEFWQHQIHGRGAIVPVWPGYVDTLRSAQTKEVAGEIGGQRIYAADLLASARADISFTEIVHRWRQDIQRHLILQWRDALPYPRKLAVRMDDLPVYVRRSLLELETLLSDVNEPLPVFQPAATAAGQQIELLLNKERSANKKSRKLQFAHTRAGEIVDLRSAFTSADNIAVLIQGADASNGTLTVIAPDGGTHEKHALTRAYGDHYRVDLSADRPVDGVYCARLQHDQTYITERCFWQSGIQK